MSNLSPSEKMALMLAKMEMEQHSTPTITNVTQNPQNDQPAQVNSNDPFVNAVRVAIETQNNNNANTVDAVRKTIDIYHDKVEALKSYYEVIKNSPEIRTAGHESYFNGFSGQIVSGKPMPAADQVRLEVVEKIGETAQKLVNAPGALLDDFETFLWVAGIGVLIFGGIIATNQIKQLTR